MYQILYFVLVLNYYKKKKKKKQRICPIYKEGNKIEHPPTDVTQKNDAGTIQASSRRHGPLRRQVYMKEATSMISPKHSESLEKPLETWPGNSQTVQK